MESLNAWRQLLDEGLSENEVMAVLRQKSRDNARTPMQWDAGPHARFQRVEPWIGLPADAATVNVATAMADPGSVLHHYRRLIALRKQYAVFGSGDYRV